MVVFQKKYDNEIEIIKVFLIFLFWSQKIQKVGKGIKLIEMSSVAGKKPD